MRNYLYITTTCWVSREGASDAATLPGKATPKSMRDPTKAAAYLSGRYLNASRAVSHWQSASISGLKACVKPISFVNA